MTSTIDLNLLNGLIERLLQPNTEIIRAASGEINEILKNPESIRALFMLLLQSNDPGVKQYCAVLVRLKLHGHWTSVDDSIREEIKKTVINFLLADNIEKNVKRQVCNLVPLVSRLCLVENEMQWPAILPTMLEMTKSPQAHFREQGVYLFNLFLDSDSLSGFLRPHLEVLHSILQASLNDPDTTVKTAALEGVQLFSSIVQISESEEPNARELQMFSSLINPSLEIMKLCLLNGLENEATSGFSLLDTIIEENISLIADVLGPIIEMVISTARSPDFDLSIRQKALYTIEKIISFRPKSLVEKNLLLPILNTVFEMAAEREEEDELEELTAHKFALQTLQSLSSNMPEKFIWEPFISKVKDYYNNPNPHFRKAAIASLAAATEGFGTKVFDQRSDLFPLIISSTNESEAVVREAAYYAIAEFCKIVDDSVIEFKEMLFPAILKGLSDPSNACKKMCLYAIQTLGEAMKDSFAELVDDIMKQLVVIFMSSPVDIQEQVICCISSCAVAVGEGFAPYFENIMNFLFKIFEEADENTAQLRSRATECVGLVATGVGSEMFSPYFEKAINYVLRGLQNNDHELREFIYNCFANLSEIFPEQIASYLPELVTKYLFATCQSSDGVIVDDRNKEGVSEHFEVDQNYNDGSVTVRLVSSFMEEKVAAISCLGTIASHAAGSFNPFFQETLSIFKELSQFIDDDVRTALAESFGDLATYLLHASDVVWEPGQLNEFSDVRVKEASDSIVQSLIEYLYDESQEVVEIALSSLGKVANVLGPASISPFIEKINATLILFLERKSECQVIKERFFDDDPDNEFSLYDSVLDFINNLSKSLRALFFPFYMVLHPHLLSHLNDHTKDDFSLTLGSIAIVCRDLGECFRPYTDDLLKGSLQYIRAEESNLRRNSVFSLGIFSRYANLALKNLVADAAKQLADMLTGDDELVIRENAAGALANIMISFPGVVDIGRIFPLLFDLMPFREDEDTANYVFEAVIKLLLNNNPVATEHIDQIISQAAINLVRNEELQDETKHQIVDILQTCLQQNPDHTNQILSNLDLSPEEQDELKESLSD